MAFGLAAAFLATFRPGAAFRRAAAFRAGAAFLAFVTGFLSLPGRNLAFAVFFFVLPRAAFAAAAFARPRLVAFFAPPARREVEGPAFRVDEVRFCPLLFTLVFFAMNASAEGERPGLTNGP